MWFIYIAAVLIVLYFVFYYYFTRNFNYWKKRNVAGPKPVPIYGNVKESAQRKVNLANVLKDIYDSFPNEKVVGIYRMTTPTLLIRDVDIIKHIMANDFNNFQDRGIFLGKEGFGNNLFHADADSWNVLRPRLNPIFTPGKLKNMFHLMNNSSDVFVNHLKQRHREDPECDVYLNAQMYTYSNIFSCVFGVDVDPFVSEVDDALKTLDKLIFTPTFVIELDMMYPGLLRKLNLSFFPTPVSKFFEKLVSDIMTQRSGKPSARNDIMDLFLQMRQSGEISSSYSSKQVAENKPLDITDDIIIAQAFVFYVAGYKPSATIISLLLYQLALNPEIQEKLRDEIKSVTKANNGEITYESLSEMEYLEQVFLETLRMYPVADPLQRMTTTDYKIPDTDLVIEKGNIVFLFVLGIHYDEKHYPNPYVFDPDRFTPELVRTRHPCTYLPFGIGPRNCIGRRFGSIQSRLGIVKILLNFRIEACKNTPNTIVINPNKLLLGPKDAVYLNLVPLEKNE